MLKIDAHNHFWKFDPVRDSWINDEMKIIQRDFLPEDFHSVLKEHGFDGCVVVQSEQSEQENEFQLGNAVANTFVKAVVGWVDLQDAAVEKRLEYYQSFSLLKGFRHLLQGEQDRSFMLRPAFKNGISLLRKYGFTYDILIFPDQLKYAEELVAAFPYQKFVIDHIAKPLIKTKEEGSWHKDVRAIAKHENVHCKISGMVTEADWKNWKKEDFHPYINTVVEAFGAKRIMYGSDWPVCKVAASYTDTLNVVKEYFSKFSSDEQADFFGGNACTFYNIQ